MKDKTIFQKEIDESALYHDYYWSRSIQNWIPKKKLIIDNVDQIFYPIKSWIFNIVRKSLFEIMNSYSCVLPNDIDKYESVINSILTPSNDKSCIVLFNHDNFATMAVFIKELYKHVSSLKNKNWINPISLKENMHIIVGPAVTTQKQFHFLNKVINVIKTIPSRDSIPWMDDKLKTIKSDFIRQILNIVEKKNQIILMAPTWTRDVLKWDLDWTINKIIFKNDDGIEKTAQLVKHFAEKWNKIFLVWTNWTWLKRPWVKKVWELNNNRTMSDIYIDIKELDNQECINYIEEKKLMSTIASLVKDHQWNILWEAIEPDDFKILKQDKKQIDVDENGHKNYCFQDSLRKKTVRKLFSLLK